MLCLLITLIYLSIISITFYIWIKSTKLDREKKDYTKWLNNNLKK